MNEIDCGFMWTQPSPLTLADFLLARIADDEAVARAEAERRRRGALSVGDTFDPARVIDECTAKKILVMWHKGEPWPNQTDDPIDMACSSHGGRWSPSSPNECREMRALAYVYRAHPDWRGDWRQ